MIRHDGKYGLFWQATLTGHDLYATTPEKGMAPSRTSYHATGKGHIYVGPDRARLIGPPSQPMDRLVGKEKVGGGRTLTLLGGTAPSVTRYTAAL